MLAPLLSLPVIPEVARELCTAMGYKYPGEIPDQEGFKKDVLATQAKLENGKEQFIADRSSIDSWVMWQRWHYPQAMSYDTEAFYNYAREQASRYTHIIYVPPMFPPVDDGFRWTDIDYQKQIDRLVTATLYNWELLNRTYTIKKMDTAERCEEVLAWLKDAN